MLYFFFPLFTYSFKPLKSFNLVAPYYDRLAGLVYGQSIRKAQTVHLNRIPPKAKILVIGGGTGWWLKQLLAHSPDCTIWYVDSSEKMLQQARAYAKGCSRVMFICGNQKHIPAMVFDVVITYFFLDLFEGKSLRDMVIQLKKKLTKGGVWIVSDFVDDRFWHRILLFLMYWFFKVVGAIDSTRLANWRVAMKSQQLECIEQAFFYRGFILSCVYQRKSEG